MIGGSSLPREEILGARSKQDCFSISGHRVNHVIRLAKFLAPLAVVALAIGGSIQSISTTNIKMLKYEKQMEALRQQIRRNDKQIVERVRREVSGSVETHLAHLISKRDAANDSELYQVQVQNVQPQITGGETYVRWGRRDCPKDVTTKLIYTGYMAGGHYTHTGSGANYMCLHSNVQYSPGKYVEGNQGGSYVYGVEFRDGGWIYQLFDLSQTEANGMQFHSVPCAMCMAEKRFTKIMIPGREVCPGGWHEEYVGYVMAGSHGDKHSTEFVCVDEKPHIVPGTIGDQQGSSLLMVETQCPSLLCEPFVAGRELRCVVCTT